MSNDQTSEFPPTEYSEIYRQILVTLAEKGAFVDLLDEFFKLLAGVDYTRLVEVEDLRLVAIQVAPEVDVFSVLRVLRSAQSVVEDVEQNRPVRLTQAVNDPLYWDQWALQRIGAEPAWRHALSVINPADPGVVVAVIDTGIHTRHPDLVGHLWNDGAGHHGRNILIDPTNINPTNINAFDVSDTDGHGTLLAGTIGAISNNAAGIAAAEWRIRLMAVKFLDARHSPTVLYGALAIRWAANHGAQIITAAWDVGLPSRLLRTAILFANSRGVLFVAGAGNDGLDNAKLPTYPATYNVPNVVSVMASDREDDRPGFSNYGRTTVHLAAPGVGILSTHTYFGTPQWRFYSGTSPACAHVVYAAALLKATNPTWTPAQIREHLVASVDLSPYLVCISGGRLSLARAVCGPLKITAPGPGVNWAKGTPNQVTWTNTYATPLCTKVRVLLSANGGPFGLLHLDSGPVAINQPTINGTCQVRAPNVSISNARLRLQSEEGPGLYDESVVFKVS